MAIVDISVGLALFAAMLAGLQALTVEYGMSNGEFGNCRSPALAAAFISIVVSVAVFWSLLAVRGVNFRSLTLLQIAPFAVAGLGNPAAFRLLYFRGIDRIGARVSAAVVCTNPALAAILAVPLFGESFTVVTALGLLCIVIGAVVLQIARAEDDSRGDLLLEELTEMHLTDLVAPLTAMVMLGLSFVLVKVGLNNLSDPLVGTAIAQTAALVALISLFGVSGSMRRQVGISDRIGLIAFTLAGVFVAGNWLAWFSALQIGTIVTVVPLANTYPLFIVAFSYLTVRQVPKSPRVIGGIVAIVAGATLMQLA